MINTLAMEFEDEKTRLNSVVECAAVVMLCALLLAKAHTKAQIPRCPRFESGRRDNNPPYYKNDQERDSTCGGSQVVNGGRFRACS